MSDKEYRILIYKTADECVFSRDVKDNLELQDGTYCAHKSHKDWVKIAPSLCETCKDRQLRGISKYEAIEKMSKAICKFYADGCEECIAKKSKKACELNRRLCDYICSSEIALNTLLGD